MIPPQLSPDEPFRLAALRSTHMLDTPLEERFERITRLACRLLKTPMSTVSLVDATRQWFKSTQGLTRSETSREVSFCGHTILEHDGVMVIPDARRDVRFKDNPLVQGTPAMVAYAGCSMSTDDGSRIGVLCVGDSKPREFDPDDLEVLRDLAAMAQDELRATVSNSVQVELLSQIEHEQRRAMVDPLTRLWNRDGFSMMLHHAIESTNASEQAIGLIMIDVDHFKQVNDMHGHPAGDEVLRQVSRRLLGAIRPSDTIGRHGGEEFVVLLPSCDSMAAALTAAERLRTALATTPIHLPDDGPCIHITASLGVVHELMNTDSNEADLFASADAAMYLAKANGRNRVEFAPQALRKAG